MLSDPLCIAQSWWLFNGVTYQAFFVIRLAIVQGPVWAYRHRSLLATRDPDVLQETPVILLKPRERSRSRSGRAKKETPWHPLTSPMTDPYVWYILTKLVFFVDGKWHTINMAYIRIRRGSPDLPCHNCYCHTQCHQISRDVTRYLPIPQDRERSRSKKRQAQERNRWNRTIRYFDIFDIFDILRNDVQSSHWKRQFRLNSSSTTHLHCTKESLAQLSLMQLSPSGTVWGEGFTQSEG